jgi:intracellular sulfur oxidation DsrE/DsrF family protein
MDNIQIKKNFVFTQTHLEIARTHLNSRMLAFPHLFNDTVFTSLSYEKMELIDESLIISDEDGSGTSQPIRHSASNPAYKDLKSDIVECGFRLHEKPIFVKRVGLGGKFVIIDGRTKHKILKEYGVKNRICVIINIDDEELHPYGNRLNSGEDSPPAGLIHENDIISMVEKKVLRNEIDVDIVKIQELIDQACGSGKFSYYKRTTLAARIFNKINSMLTTGLEPVAWSNGKEVESWLTKHNYVETPTVVYLPYSSEAPAKCIAAAAKLAQTKPDKEIRVVVYITAIKSIDIAECYINNVTKFKEEWYEGLECIGNHFFNTVDMKKSKIKLYGYVPSNIKDICEDMTKLIVIGKNDQKIDLDYLYNNRIFSNLESFLETPETETI